MKNGQKNCTDVFIYFFYKLLTCTINTSKKCKDHITYFSTYSTKYRIKKNENSHKIIKSFLILIKIADAHFHMVYNMCRFFFRLFHREVNMYMMETKLCLQTDRLMDR